MIIVDLHNHTSYGSPCGYQEPGELIEQAKQVGLDGVCITEHNQLWDPAAIQRLCREHDFLVLGGVEVNTNFGEILAFGIHRSVMHIFDAYELRKLADSEGGILVAAHPFRGSLLTKASNTWERKPDINWEELFAHPLFELVDAIEVYNGLGGIWEPWIATKVSEHLKIPGTGGSDSHAVLGVGVCFTVFENTIKSEQDLIREIKGGKYHGASWRTWDLLNRRALQHTS